MRAAIQTPARPHPERPPVIEPVTRRGLVMVLSLALSGLCGAATPAPRYRDVSSMPLESDLPLSEPAQIQRFEITPAPEQSDGQHPTRLRIEVAGSPGGRVTVALTGLTRRAVRLDEVQPGVYVATYALRRDDRLRPEATALATLDLGRQRVQRRLPQPRAVD